MMKKWRQFLPQNVCIRRVVRLFIYCHQHSILFIDSMNNQIYDVNAPFEFDKLRLSPPMIISGGNYFIKYSCNNNPLYIQPPECKTRGPISQSSKKAHCDLMFSQDKTCFIKWMEDLETVSCKLIYENRENWFDGDMDLADIENYFASPLKSYKSGKFYLARAFLPSRLGKINLKIYNESKEEVDIDSIVDQTDVMSILEIQGIKCSSRSFQIEMEIKQMMTLQPVNPFENCLITNRKVEVVPSASTMPSTTNEIPSPRDSGTLEENVDVFRSVVNSQESLNVQKVDYNENVPLKQKEFQEKNPSIENSGENIENVETEKSSESEEEEEGTMVLPPPLPETLEKNDEMALDDLEFHVHLDDLDKDEVVTIRPQNDIYYERYREAQKRAMIAKNLALQAYLEAKEIKNTYQLTDIESDDDSFFLQENSDEELESKENHENGDDIVKEKERFPEEIHIEASA